MRISKVATGFGMAALIALSSAAASVAHAETVLNRGNGPEPDTLDPHKASQLTDLYIINDVGEGLTTLNPKGETVPGVAQKWDVSADGLTYTFHLRPNAKWSNGEPLTAEDFVYSFRRVVDPATAAEYASVLGIIKNAAAIVEGKEKDLSKLGVEAVDAKTLKITLEQPAPYLLSLLTMPVAFPVYKKAVEQHGDQFARPGKAVTNGAFVVTEWTPQSTVTAVKNPHFHDAANVKLDKVVYHNTEDPATELKRFRAGELDYTYSLPTDQMKLVKSELSKNLRNTPSLGIYYYGVNLAKEPLGKQAALRKALALSINRSFLTEGILQGGEVPAYAWIPPGMPGYEPQSVEWAKMNQDERNALAKKLFAEAGYGPDKPLKFQLLYPSGGNHKKIAVALEGMWKQVLGNVQIEQVTQESKIVRASRNQRNFEVVRASWFADFADPVNFLDMFMSSEASRNEWGYKNDQYDTFMMQAAKEIDPAKRMKLMAQAEKVLLNDLPIIPIYFYTSAHLVSDKVQGYEDNALTLHLSRYMSIKK